MMVIMMKHDFSSFIRNLFLSIYLFLYTNKIAGGVDPSKVPSELTIAPLNASKYPVISSRINNTKTLITLKQS